MASHHMVTSKNCSETKPHSSPSPKPGTMSLFKVSEEEWIFGSAKSDGIQVCLKEDNRSVKYDEGTNSEAKSRSARNYNAVLK